MEFLPNLFVLGAAKCGTTTLHAYLESSDGVCMSEPKEPFFFECEYSKGLKYYRNKYFSHWKGEPIIGESRHRNLYLPYVPKRIHDLNSNAKLVVCVRNPVDRAFSHWWHWYSRKREKLDFPDAIQADIRRIDAGRIMATEEEMKEYCERLGFDGYSSSGYGIYRTYVDSGYYYQQMQRYLELFERNQLKVLLFEDLVRDPRGLISELALFLENEMRIPSDFHPRRENVRRVEFFNPANRVFRIFKSLALRLFVPESLWASGRRLIYRAEQKLADRWEMDPETRQFLTEHYRPHNYALADYLQCDLSHWCT